MLDVSGARSFFLAALAFASRAWAAGQALDLAHPILPTGVEPDSAAKYEQAAAALMALDDEEVLAYVPPWTYVQYCECPRCYGGVEGNGVFTWSPDQPDRMACRFCGFVWPHDEYAEKSVLSGQNLLGETVSLPYYTHPDNGVPHFFSAHLLGLKRRWLTAQTAAVARAYVATGNERYAARVAFILDAFAQRYPHYPVMQNLPRRVSFREQKAPWPWDSGRWNFFHNNIPIELLPAYDMVYLSPAFDALSAARGYDVRERIEQDFLKPACEEIMLREDHVNNCVGYDVRSAALLGRVLGEPRYVHWAYHWMKRNLTEGFLRDGFWKEGSASYHAMTIGGLTSAFAAVQGYSDPTGYLDPVDGTRYDQLDPSREFPFWELVQTAPNRVAWPNGCTPTTHDAWPYERRAAVRDATVSALLPAVGQASLGRGRGENQLQVQLHFSGAYGHQHHDNLDLTLWAKGREMLPDIGYTWTQMRCWTTSTVCHNTVVVDRANQGGGGPSDGNLLAWYPGDTSDPEAQEVSLVEADGALGYRRIEDLDLYRRTAMVVPVSANDAYVVDVFRVRGGRLHDWALHGDADQDVAARCNLPLGEPLATLLLPDEEWVEPTQEAHTYPPYGMLRDMRPAAADNGCQVESSYLGDASPGYRLHLLPCSGGQLLFGRSPSVRRMGQGAKGDMRKAYDYWMPQLLLRRTGDHPLTSVFTAVHEPHDGAPFLADVRPLQLSPPDPLATALAVRWGEAEDTIVSLATTPEAPVTANGIALRGRAAVVRRVAGRVTGIWLFGGGEVSGLDFAVTTAAPPGGEIVATLRRADGDDEDALITTAELPVGEALRGYWLIATYPNGITQGYEIASVASDAPGRTRIVTAGDHGLCVQDGQVEEAYFPRRKLTGTVRCEIPALASLTRRADDTWRVTGTGPVEASLDGAPVIVAPGPEEKQPMASRRAAPDWVCVTPQAGWQPRDSMGDLVFQDHLWVLGGWFGVDVPNPLDVWKSPDGRHWTCVQDHAPWIYSDLPAAFVFGDRMWLMGGRKQPDNTYGNTVWSSADGVEWRREGEAPWCPRVGAAFAVFRDRMWILGGTRDFYQHDDEHVLNDVWSSPDGRHWELVTPSAGWSKRAHLQALVHDGKLWVMTGGRWSPQYEETSDVWCSEDGAHWTQVTTAAPWEPRIWSAAAVYRGRMWILGGWSKPHGNFGDVWCSRDGKRWEELVSQVIWRPRHEHSAYVFRDRLWVAGGHADPLNSEVWALELPPDYFGAG